MDGAAVEIVARCAMRFTTTDDGVGPDKQSAAYSHKRCARCGIASTAMPSPHEHDSVRARLACRWRSRPCSCSWQTCGIAPNQLGARPLTRFGRDGRADQVILICIGLTAASDASSRGPLFRFRVRILRDGVARLVERREVGSRAAPAGHVKPADCEFRRTLDSDPSELKAAAIAPKACGTSTGFVPQNLAPPARAHDPS